MCRRYLPEKAGLHIHRHRCRVVTVEDHRVDFIKLIVSERFVSEGLIILKGDVILLVHGDVLLETRALQRRRTSLGLVQACTSRQHDVVKGADGLAGGLYPQTVCQIEGLDSIIKSGGAIVGSTRGVGQGMRVDGWLRSIIVDIGSKGGLLGVLVMSVSLLSAMACAASLSLGRSISARTTIGPALLLLLGKLGVSWLVLHSTKLVGLWALTAAMSGAFLLKGEHGGLHDTFRLEILDLIRRCLAENLSYDLHSRRELAEDNHGLHGGREIEASIFEIREVAQHLGNRRSGMGASRDGSRKELAKLSIGRTDTGGTETLLEVVPHLLNGSKVSDSDLDGGGEAQGDVTERSISVVIPVVSVIVTIGGLSS